VVVKGQGLVKVQVSSCRVGQQTLEVSIG